MLIGPSRVRGPLAPFAHGFVCELKRQGYRRRTVCSQLQLLAHLSRWLAGEGFGAEQLCPSEEDRFVRAHRAAGYRYPRSIKAMRPILAYLRNLGVTPPPPPPPATCEGPVDEMAKRYRRYLTVERGLCDRAACEYVARMRPFLERRLLSSGLTLDLGNLTGADVVSFVAACCPHQRHHTARMTVTALRSLLGFLHVEGIIAQSLAAYVPSVACRRLAGLPKGLAPDQVRRLLTSCDRSTTNGCRDFTVLILLVRLGLRAGEVAMLRIDDIDWRIGEIVVRGKGSTIERLPLPTDVGDAVAAYLRGGRPPSARGREVFTRVLAPHHALTSGGVTQIVAAAGRRAGLGLLHSHRLRHTAATLMLRAGAALPEIGQLLRHRRAMTTAIYAKVDHNALRTLARPWPGEVA
jgi:integrase/recombinase XerD